MKNNMNKKGLVLAFVVLFVGTSVASNISGYIVSNNVENNRLNVTKDTIHIKEKQGGSIRGTDWWPMFLHDLQHSGNSTSDAPNTNRVEWIFQVDDGGVLSSSPAVYNNKVYIGTDLDRIYCLDADNGSMIWNYTTGGGVLSSSPAVYNSKVYIGNTLYESMICLDADNGSMIWDYYVGTMIASSPAVYNGKVYFTGGGWGGNGTYCLDADNGSMIWNYTMGAETYSSPAIAYDKVYFGSGDYKVYCLNADNGSMIWNYTTGVGVESSPAIADGKVYIGSGDKKVYCLDAYNGSVIWTYTTGGGIIESPAIAYNKVYIASGNGKVYCLNANNGSMIWSNQVGYRYSSPAVADGKVYIGGTQDNKTYCLDADIGSMIWNYTTTGWVYSPAIADGKVYIGSGNGKVYCFGNQQPITPSNPNPQNGATNMSVDIKLSWTSGDLDDSDTVYYDVYLGTNQNPPFKERIGPYPSTQTRITYDPGILNYTTNYYWKIIADDNWETSEGQIWNFTTYLYPPISNFTYTPINPTKEDVIQFYDTSTDSDGSVVKWMWNFGDHYLSDLQNPIHCYYISGSYNVSLTVTDNYGANDSFVRVINISDVVGLISELQQGWNIMGLPFKAYLAKEDLIIQNNSINYTWQEAIDEGIILGFIYGWNRNTQNYILSDDLDPGYGYWIYTYYDCILLRPTN